MSNRDTQRAKLLKAVSGALGHRRLIWSGLRGEDIEALADLPQLDAAFSIIGRYGHRASVQSMAYEDACGERPDMEEWDIDDHRFSPATIEFRRAHLAALSQPSALLPYRPSRFLSSIWFARSDRCVNLGVFGDLQSAFEHKPWVETSLAALGVDTIPWRYVPDEEQVAVERLLLDGPVVLRPPHTSGGAGVAIVHDHEELLANWPDAPEAFVSVAPFIDGLPINVGATVWADGVTVHHASVQLIGIPSCVARPFGYCGNDFALAGDLDRRTIDDIDKTTSRIGEWLRGHGYLGTFGVDYLLADGRLLFTEINPRFQGSTSASARMSVEHGEPCLLLEHVAAHLGIPRPPSRASLAERMRNAELLSQFVVHSTAERAMYFDPEHLVADLQTTVGTLRVDVRVRPDVLTHPGATIVRTMTRASITSNGFDLSPPWSTLIAEWTHSLIAAPIER